MRSDSMTLRARNSSRFGKSLRVILRSESFSNSTL